jgi:hypothetical protein
MSRISSLEAAVRVADVDRSEVPRTCDRALAVGRWIAIAPLGALFRCRSSDGHQVPECLSTTVGISRFCTGPPIDRPPD